jgi:hypothetical protein
MREARPTTRVARRGSPCSASRSGGEGLNLPLRTLAVALSLSGCGRIAFEPLLTYRDAVIADAPVAYWRFGDSGVAARDEMGNADGAYSGTCAVAEGALRGDPNLATRFDGTCSVMLPDIPALAFFGNAMFTVEVWIANSQIPAYYHYVTRQVRNPTTGYALLLFDLAPPGVYLERFIDGSGKRTIPVPVTTTEFVHVVGTYDGTQLQLTLDGVAGAPVTDLRPMPAFASDPLIGRNAVGAWFQGAIDEVAIYDHVLGPDRIELHRQLALTGPIPRP